LPEPAGALLASQEIERPQEDPYERRILADGAVWERSSSHATVEEGALRFERVPLEWREIARLAPEAVGRLEDAIRSEGVLDLEPEHSPPGTAAGGSIVTYRVALDGREHAIRLVNLAPERVPAVGALDMAMQLAVAEALQPE
jgi:hypothetical protein